MAVVETHRRSSYQPLSDDPNIRARVNQELDKKANIPVKVHGEYPQRGDDIYLKVKSVLDTNKDKPIVILESILTEQTYIDDMLVVLCSFGSSPARLNACKQAIELLRRMNPMPKVVMCEGCVDGVWSFDYVKQYERFNYIPVDLQSDDYANFFCKECLWNQAANTMMQVDSSITKLVFLDADCFFVDRFGFSAINDAFTKYDIISPHRACYYTGSNTEASNYGLLNSIGFNVVKGLRHSGYQGFSLGITKEAYATYFNNQLPNPSLGMGDIFYWYMLTGRTLMKGFKMLPYCEKEMEKYLLPTTIRIGHGDQVIGHIDHGRVDERIYKVRAQLMKMIIQTPLAETAQAQGSYIVGWRSCPQADDLRDMYLRIRVENRREIKITTYEETKQYYEWVRGISPNPPKCILPNRFTVTGNKMPLQECAIPAVTNKHIPF